MTAIAIHKDTGEVLEVPQFDPTAYLATLKDHTQAQALAAAYDAACKALIGPNDVQKEGSREFKKKSAWRKLARHFRISTVLVGEPIVRWNGEEFLAYATVRAIAPWGQHAEAVGACGSDEEVGARKISWSDAVATAQTRATNRAVSDLIAMGEVSADELAQTNRKAAQTPKAKVPLAERNDESLKELRQWAEKEGKTDLVGKIDAEFERRALAAEA